MLRMVSYPHRPQSGHFICYLNRTYHVLPTNLIARLDRVRQISHDFGYGVGDSMDYLLAKYVKHPG